MKKLIYCILPFLILIYAPCIYVKAAFAVDPATLASLSSGAESLQYSLYASGGLMPYQGNSSQDLTALLNSKLEKRSRYTVTNDDITSSVSIFDAPYEMLQEAMTWDWVGADGSSITIDDLVDARYITFDNGFYSGEAFVNGDGELLYRNITGEGSSDRISTAQMRVGGSLASYQDMADAVTAVNQQLSGQSFQYDYNDPTSTNDYSFFYAYGSWGGTIAESLYIANMFLPGQIVPINISNNTIISSWYTNDLSLFNHDIILSQGGSSNFSYTEGNYSKGGYNYRYKVNFGTFGSLPQMSYSDWLSDINHNATFWEENRIYTNAMSDYDGSNVGTFAPTEGVFPADLSTAMSLAATQTLATALADIKPMPALDDEHAKGVVFPVSFAWDPDLPWVDEDEEEAVVPEIGELITDELPIGDDFSVPLVQGLQGKFPFSIPWDLKNMMKGLRAVRRAPNFNFSLYFRPIDYTWNLNLDLSAFDSLASLFRTCFLILFVIGLCKFSYDHFFGS